LIDVVLGVPGSGKSYSARKWAIKSVQNGYTVLWLSPLNSEKKRLLHYFQQYLEEDQVKILPTKPEKCPIMNNLAKNMPQAYPFLSAALCRVCRLRDSCPYYKEIREVLEDIKAGKPRLYIGGFSYVFLAAIINRVVVDEFDQLYPSMYKVIPRQLVEGMLKLLEQIDQEAAKELAKRIVPSPFSDGYLLKPPAIVDMFLDRGRLQLISATYSPDPFRPDPRLILGTEEDDSVNLHFVPHPPRDDRFIAVETVVYHKSRHKYYLYSKIVREIQEQLSSLSDTSVTIIARSKKEAAYLYKKLTQAGVQALAEGVNWTKANPGDWRHHNVRVLVIGGLFHRSLDIDSDKVYAFYQHPPPHYPRSFALEYPDAVAVDPEAHIIPVMRAHVQTLFRATRAWSKSHEVILLDKTWLRPLEYYPHVWSYVEPRLEIEKRI
jgi:hypothetical protein